MNSRRAVVLVGGWAHPGHDQAIAARALLEPHGFLTTVVTDPECVVEELAAGCDLLVVAACWFAMADDRYSVDQRAEHAVVLSHDAIAALDQLRANGCPLLALHTAVLCFDDWEPWRSWLGAAWNWDTSTHPEPGEFNVRPASASTVAFSDFEVLDELYSGLDVHASVQLVAISDDGDPLVWLNETALGRSVVNVLGHDQRSLGNPAHQRLNAQLLNWLLA